METLFVFKMQNGIGQMELILLVSFFFRALPVLLDSDEVCVVVFHTFMSLKSFNHYFSFL